MNVREALASRRLYFDGGTGTLLQQLYGLKPGEPPESFNLPNGAAVIETHRRYLAAGADIISTNTFGVHAHKYVNADALIEAAVSHARAAVTEAKKGWVALDIGPTGRLLAPMGDLGFEEAYGLFFALAKRGAECGADLIIIETMADLYELKAAVLAAKTTGLPVFATMTFDERGHTLTGADPACMAALLNGLGVDAMGMNCGYGPAPYNRLLPALLQNTDIPLIIQPNAGLPVMENGVARYDLSPQDFAAQMANMAEQGVRVLGGCCGTSPAHIEALRAACAQRGMTGNPPAAAKPVVICSGSKNLRLDTVMQDCIERCLETEPDAMADEAMELAETADIVEICVDDPQAVTAVQEMVREPLSLNAASPEALLAAVRLYNGRPMVNAQARAFGDTAETRQRLTDALLSYGAVIM